MKISNLADVLLAALDQAESGKGKSRHALGDEDFGDQLICYLQRRGLDFARGQAVKKIDESMRLGAKEAIEELLGAIVYCAAAIIVLQEKEAENEG